MKHRRPRRGHPTPAPAALRALTAVGLAVDAAVHALLAPGYQAAAPAGIGEGNLFLAEAAAAVLVALYVLVRGTRPAFALALAAAAGGLAALLLYRYIDIPALGPLPAMYEPVWYPAKALAAVAQALATLTAAAALAALARPRRSPPALPP
ncbi:hypothetical protein [Sinomonas sp. P47F7]|uniref:hypothetical protein n=1 Tax=Sinomonas sp. P47F7 TaxID=3410987 RepID=UPI003BF564AD